MKKTLFLLSLAGTFFSGYLSAVKFFSQTCAFGETCPLFIGYPACYVGFGLFLILAILTGIYLWKQGTRQHTVLNTTVLIALLGVFFSGYFSFLEIPALMRNGFGFYTFGLPTCILGFFFFVAVFVCSLIQRLRIEA